MNVGEVADLMFQGLMEFLVIVLSRAAHIRSGLWSSNGLGMLDQVSARRSPSNI